MKKIFTTLSVAACAVAAVAQTVSPINEETQLLGESMSPNRQYVVGTNYSTYAPAIWVVNENRVVNFPEAEEGQFHGVSNNGLAVGSKGYAVKATLDGVLVELYADKGELIEEDWGSYYTGEAGSDAWGITPDGTVIVGDYYDSSYLTHPCLWIGDERIDLPMPDASAVPFAFDGAGARFISDDASVVVGYLNDDFGLWPAMVWRKNAAGGYDCDPVCVDYFETEPGQGKPFMTFEARGVSANGEWISLNCSPEYDMWNWEPPTVQCGRMNLKTKQLEVYGDGSEDFAMYGIANDGTAVGFTETGAMFGRQGAIWFPGYEKPQMFNDLFPDNEYFETLKGDMAANAPGYITADAQYIQGFGMANNDNMDISSYIVETPSPLTAINDVKVDTEKKVQGAYDLTGRRINENNLTRGIYIINGKKVVK
ncbi:hypothetical protein [Sodaliphilus sp.]|uniref:hypothetical protein n=1 Tax=Sodaliphilus sp. TaxID=2815818 RepID=UPI00388DC315